MEIIQKILDGLFFNFLLLMDMISILKEMSMPVVHMVIQKIFYYDVIKLFYLPHFGLTEFRVGIPTELLYITIGVTRTSCKNVPYNMHILAQ